MDNKQKKKNKEFLNEDLENDGHTEEYLDDEFEEDNASKAVS